MNKRTLTKLLERLDDEDEILVLAYGELQNIDSLVVARKYRECATEHKKYLMLCPILPEEEEEKITT